jgi:hypothetical protein
LVVSMAVAAADCPVSGALVEAVSLAVVAPFSELPEPWCEAAEPAEPSVSMAVAAADCPVTGALVEAVSLAVVAPFSELPEP